MIKIKKFIPNTNNSVGKSSYLSESRQNMLVYSHQIIPAKAEQFLGKYPAVRKSMMPYLELNIRKGYNKWLKWKNSNEDKLGGKPNTVSSPHFGTKTFYKFDWPQGMDGWAAMFQYLHTQKWAFISTQV